MGLSSKDVSSAGDFDWSQQIGGELDTAKPAVQANSKRPLGPAAAAIKCPRCESSNTKFCYYNNYSRTQPRHFCRACKRHWTEGGTLRNVPVGGSRKNKRPRTENADRRPQQQQAAAAIDNGFTDVFRRLMFPAALSASLPLLSDCSRNESICGAADCAGNPYSISDLWSSSQYDSYGGQEEMVNGESSLVNADKWLQEPVSNWNCWDVLEQAAADDYSSTGGY